MTVTVGRIRPDRLFDCRFTALVNNLVRGAAGAAVPQIGVEFPDGYAIIWHR